MPTSIRLDPATDLELERLARRSGTSKSAVMRRAIRELVDRETVKPYERVSDLLGIATGGPENLSERTGDKLRAMLRERDD